MEDCKLEYMPTRDQAFCLTHKRFERQCLRAEIEHLKAQAKNLQAKLDEAYPIIEAARTVYEIREATSKRANGIGAVGAYEQYREAHREACEALDRAVAQFTSKQMAESGAPLGEPFAGLPEKDQAKTVFPPGCACSCHVLAFFGHCTCCDQVRSF